MSNNIIFGTKTPALKPRYETKKNTDLKPRKKRSDAKNDVKFKVSINDYKKLKFKSKDHKMSLTAFCSLIVKDELIKKNDYETFDYDNDGHFIHICLEEDYFEMLQTAAIEWGGLSWRKAAHRIIKNYLLRTSGGYRIINYNSR